MNLNFHCFLLYCNLLQLQHEMTVFSSFFIMLLFLCALIQLSQAFHISILTSTFTVCVLGNSSQSPNLPQEHLPVLSFMLVLTSHQLFHLEICFNNTVFHFDFCLLKHKIYTIKFQDQLVSEKLGKVLTLSCSLLVCSLTWLCDKYFSYGFPGVTSNGDGTQQQLKVPVFFMCISTEDNRKRSIGSDTDKYYLRGKAYDTAFYLKMCGPCLFSEHSGG